jgi:hypothetical protein
VRNIVKCGLKDKFEDVYRPYFDSATIDKLYLSIQSGLKPQINTNKKRKRGGKKSTRKSKKRKTKKSRKNITRRNITRRMQ